MSDLTKVQESLQGAGFSADQIAAILNGAQQIKQKGDEAVEIEGIRKKTFDQAAAETAVAQLAEQFQQLQQQIAALELTRTAQKALDEAAASGPQQEVYTLDDIKEVVQKAVESAIQPFIEGQKQEANATVTLWDQVSQLTNAAQVAQKSIQELSGELPRSLQQQGPRRYTNPATGDVGGSPPAMPIALPTSESPFSWVDEYMQSNG